MLEFTDIKGNLNNKNNPFIKYLNKKKKKKIYYMKIPKIYLIYKINLKANLQKIMMKLTKSL